MNRTRSNRSARADREWLVTNGLGGYASGVVGGPITRRYHGLLVAALPAPLGRLVMVSCVEVRLRTAAGDVLSMDAPLTGARAAHGAAMRLERFGLEAGLPVWRFTHGAIAVERRIVMPHGQNTTCLVHRVVAGGGDVQLELQPWLHVRHYEGSVCRTGPWPYAVTTSGERVEVQPGPPLPALRLRLAGGEAALTPGQADMPHHFEEEGARGYDCDGRLWSPGVARVNLGARDSGGQASLVMSTEPWSTVDAISANEAIAVETSRREALLDRAGIGDEFARRLVLAADQFIISPPRTRAADTTLTDAAGSDARTVIAGYHWFTDWGRDTMIALEGLTLTTGRHGEAASILRTFAGYVRDGLIPNMFPDAGREGLYHTADATLWFFHAIHRYLEVTGDTGLLDDLLPVLRGIVDHHVRGTRFGIAVDPQDGLLTQGAPGLALTWMDAAVDGWVVTPRRGKAVEINALYYNALRLLGGWLRDRDAPAARELDAAAERLRDTFNRRFWYCDGSYLYDVVDGEQGDDPACRPNQLLAISLAHPVLDRSRWRAVLDTVRRRLLTPCGLRSLASGHPDYQPRYYGDRRTRDGAYHQGTVWAWWIGPLVDAWLRVAPEERHEVEALVRGFEPHLDEAGVGSISEIFDAEAPWTPRGCIAQAWSVAEVLRARAV